jgi:hypothetical protein
MTKSNKSASKTASNKAAPKKNAPSMNPSLATKALELKKLLSERTTKDAKTLYRVAAVVAEIKNDEKADAKKYGKGSVKRLAAELAYTGATLYAYARVAEVWNEEAFEHHLKAVNAKGFPLSFSHFVELARELDAEKRNRLLEKAFAKSLSVRDIAKEIPRSAPPKAKSLTVTVNGLLVAAEKEAAKIAQLVTSGGALSTDDVRTSIVTLVQALDVYRTTLEALRTLEANGDKFDLAAE